MQLQYKFQLKVHGLTGIIGVLVQEEQKTEEEHMLTALYHAQVAIMKQEFVVAPTQDSEFHMKIALALALVLPTLVKMFLLTMYQRQVLTIFGWVTAIQITKN